MRAVLLALLTAASAGGAEAPRRREGAARTPTDSVLELGAWKWRLTEPIGFRRRALDNRPASTMGRMEWEAPCGRRSRLGDFPATAGIRLEYRPGSYRADKAGGALLQSRCGGKAFEKREGQHFSAVTFSLRCEGEDIYELHMDDFFVVMRYEHSDCPRERLLQTFLDCARSLSPVDPPPKTTAEPAMSDGPVRLLR